MSYCLVSVCWPLPCSFCSLCVGFGIVCAVPGLVEVIQGGRKQTTSTNQKIKSGCQSSQMNPTSINNPISMHRSKRFPRNGTARSPVALALISFILGDCVLLLRPRIGVPICLLPAPITPALPLLPRWPFCVSSMPIRTGTTFDLPASCGCIGVASEQTLSCLAAFGCIHGS